MVAVAHGDIIQTYLLALLGLDPRGAFPFVLDNASISVVEVGPQGSRVLLLNDTCHLSREGR